MSESTVHPCSDKMTLTPLDISEFLSTEERIASYIESVAEENDWPLLSLAIGHAAKSVVMSRLATELRIDRDVLYSNQTSKSIPIQAVFNALKLEAPTTKLEKAHKIVRISSHNDYSIVLTYDDGVVGKFSITPYLETGVFTELKDLEYFHKVENHGDSLVWPHEQDLCAGSIYHSMERIEQDPLDSSDELEDIEIERNLSLNQSMDRGIQDALRGRGRFVYSPERNMKFDAEELDVLEDAKTISRPLDEQALEFSQILIDAIRSLSEREFCAGWRCDIEFELWDLIHMFPQQISHFTITQAQRTHFKILSSLSQGWIHFGNEGEKWVSLDEWASLFSAWKERNPG